MRQVAARVVLRLILYTYLFILASFFVDSIKMLAGKYYYFPNSHISSIDTPTYEAENVVALLDNFNEMCDIDIVRYKHTIGINRPIEIEEVDYFLFSPRTLGRAWIGREDCTIQIKKYMDIMTFRLVLLHEYLHCMGYNHVSKKTGDLMSPAIGKITGDNIESYAKDLCRIVKWSNSLKN